jgi:CheY-like chemotaxis protein
VTRVLIAEDEVDIRQLARLMLELAGHEVIEAADGGAALSILASDPDIDVVLLDLRLPGHNGWEVLAQLRAQGRAVAPRVVVFSAQIEPRDYDRARREGASGFLEKPFSEDDLLAAVAEPV